MSCWCRQSAEQVKDAAAQVPQEVLLAQQVPGAWLHPFPCLSSTVRASSPTTPRHVTRETYRAAPEGIYICSVYVYPLWLHPVLSTVPLVAVASHRSGGEWLIQRLM